MNERRKQVLRYTKNRAVGLRITLCYLWGIGINYQPRTKIRVHSYPHTHHTYLNISPEESTGLFSVDHIKRKVLWFLFCTRGQRNTLSTHPSCRAWTGLLLGFSSSRPPHCRVTRVNFSRASRHPHYGSICDVRGHGPSPVPVPCPSLAHGPVHVRAHALNAPDHGQPRHSLVRFSCPSHVHARARDSRIWHSLLRSVSSVNTGIVSGNVFCCLCCFGSNLKKENTLLTKVSRQYVVLIKPHRRLLCSIPLSGERDRLRLRCRLLERDILRDDDDADVSLSTMDSSLGDPSLLCVPIEEVNSAISCSESALPASSSSSFLSSEGSPPRLTSLIKIFFCFARVASMAGGVGRGACIICACCSINGKGPLCLGRLILQK